MELLLEGIKETCLYIEDTSRSRNFYEQVLGLKVWREAPGKFIFFRVGDDMLLCFVRDFVKGQLDLPQHYAQGQQHVAFAVSPQLYEAWKKHIRNHGIPIEDEVNWGKGRSFYFRDPDGHLLEIVEPAIWEK